MNEIYQWKHEAKQSNGRADWQVAIKCHSKMMKQGMNMLFALMFQSLLGTQLKNRNQSNNWMKMLSELPDSHHSQTSPQNPVYEWCVYESKAKDALRVVLNVSENGNERNPEWKERKFKFASYWFQENI